MQVSELKVSSGSDLKNALEVFSKENKITGYILGSIGNLSKAIFQCPKQPKPSNLDGPLEILNINGRISPQGTHLHITISDKNGQVWGGHLEEGSIVLKQVEVLIGLLDDSDLLKRLDITNELKPKFKVEIAVLPGCPWCKRAIKMFNTLSVPHEIIVISNDRDFNSYKNKSGFSTFPQIFINNKFIGGYTELTEYHALGKLEELRN